MGFSGGVKGLHADRRVLYFPDLDTQCYFGTPIVICRWRCFNTSNMNKTRRFPGRFARVSAGDFCIRGHEKQRKNIGLPISTPLSLSLSLFLSLVPSHSLTGGRQLQSVAQGGLPRLSHQRYHCQARLVLNR